MRQHSPCLPSCTECHCRCGKPTVACFIDFASTLNSAHTESIWFVIKMESMPVMFAEVSKEIPKLHRTSSIFSLYLLVLDKLVSSDNDFQLFLD